MKQLSKWYLTCVMVIVAIGFWGTSNAQKGANRIVEWGPHRNLVVTNGWTPAELSDITESFMRSNPYSSDQFAELRVTKLDSLEYQLSFPSELNLHELLKYMLYLDESRHNTRSEQQGIAVVFFRVAIGGIDTEVRDVAFFVTDQSVQSGMIYSIDQLGEAVYIKIDSGLELGTKPLPFIPERIAKIIGRAGFKLSQD